ncbi:MAG: DUF6465 family protein [Clostridiales bacterium]|jgi:hypothetical protein|nr:DUF6465 family protein [Clostridiales bacterium]
MKTNFCVEFNGKSTDDKFAVRTGKDAWVQAGNKIKDLESMDFYVKPEESKCYYVLNGDFKGSFDI